MAQPTPPPMTADLFQPLGMRGHAERPDEVVQTDSPSSSVLSSAVVAPTIWKMIVTLPFSRS